MSKRLQLSPVQRDIVLLLEEAGSETLRTIFATLMPASPSLLITEIDGLVELGLVRKVEVSGAVDTELVLTDAGRKAVRT